MSNSRVSELFGRSLAASTDIAEQRIPVSQPEAIDWDKVVTQQHCPLLGKRCFKVRKSDPSISIGTCIVRHGRAQEPLIICPARFLERHQFFFDCLHLLTTHRPGNELHVVADVGIPGGSVDYFLVSALKGKVKDFVGIEVQTLDTTGTVWPERQRALRTLGVDRIDDAEQSLKTFGMNWKMTAKTILVQIHHKIRTFENLDKKLVLVIQDKLLDYMQKNFVFSHIGSAVIGHAMQFHSYRLSRDLTGGYRIDLNKRLSTNGDGVKKCLGLRSAQNIEMEEIHRILEDKISQESTMLLPVISS